MLLRKNQFIKRPQSDKAEIVNLVKRQAKKDTEKGIEVKEDRVSLKALAFISSWNQYSNQSIISKVYHKLVNIIRRI